MAENRRDHRGSNEQQRKQQARPPPHVQRSRCRTEGERELSRQSPDARDRSGVHPARSSGALQPLGAGDLQGFADPHFDLASADAEPFGSPHVSSVESELMSKSNMNDRPSPSTDVHRSTSENQKIRNVHQSKGIQYTVDVIPKYMMINGDPSPSIPRTPEPIPMHHHAPPLPLVELSLADAVALIEKAQDLPTRTQSQWVCSLRQIARGLDRPLELIPARWTGLRLPVSRLHHLPLGVTAKTLANHKANLRAALRWIGGETGLPARGVPLTALWAKLVDEITDKRLRARLYGLARYASAKGVDPAEVDDAFLRAYLGYRAETTALATGVAAHRSIARSWNRCMGEIEGWPQQRLAEPDLPDRRAGPEGHAFPEGLRSDLDSYLAGLTRPRRTSKGKRIRPCKPSTIRTRRAELEAFVRKAVEIGIPLAELTSLSALLQPDIVRQVLDAYWVKDGAEPKGYTIDLAWKLLCIARETQCLTESQLAE